MPPEGGNPRRMNSFSIFTDSRHPHRVFQIESGHWTEKSPSGGFRGPFAVFLFSLNLKADIHPSHGKMPGRICRAIGTARQEQTVVGEKGNIGKNLPAQGQVDTMSNQ